VRAGTFSPCESDADAVVEVDDAAPESALIQKLEPSAHLVGQCALAATDEDRAEEQVALVDEARRDGLAGELRTTNGDIGYRRLLEPPDRAGSNSRSIRVLALVTV
jgi:hypothetical protein